MKKKTLLSGLVLTLVLLCGMVLGAGASNGLQTIQAYLNSNIKITYDGVEKSLMDTKGNRIYPITYKGTTYLPVRALSDVLGIDIGWDDATKTVKMGKQPKGVDLIDTYKVYQFAVNGERSFAGQVQSSAGKTAEIGGVTCSHWLYFGTPWWQASDAWATFNLLGKHDTLTFSYFSSADATLIVYGDDGDQLGEYKITGGAVSQTVTIPLFKTRELKFEAKMPNWGTQLTIFDAYLDAEE